MKQSTPEQAHALKRHVPGSFVCIRSGPTARGMFNLFGERIGWFSFGIVITCIDPKQWQAMVLGHVYIQLAAELGGGDMCYVLNSNTMQAGWIHSWSLRPA